jgi:predicted methyltransferase
MRIWIARVLPAMLLCVTPFAFATDVGDEPVVKGAPAKLNERFVDPELQVDTWVERFEGESREVFAARHEVLSATEVAVGDRVVDIGAGTGLYTQLFAEAVGEKGWVYAVDISPPFLVHINRKAAEVGLANVTTVLGHVDSIQLPPASVEHAFVCDTYHHLEAVEPMLASIHRALVSGGQLVVIDFDRIPGQSREWILDHVRAGKGEFRAEIEAAGFVFVEEVEIPAFEENYFIKFKKK